MGRPDKVAIEQMIYCLPAFERLRAIVPGGFNAVSPAIRRALLNDDLSGALKLANVAYAKDGPSHQIASFTYLCLLCARGLIDEASGVLRKLSAHHEGNPALALLQVDLLIQQERHDDAASLMEGLGALTAQPHERWELLADLYLKLDLVEQAAASLARALDAGCQDADIAYSLARLHMELDAPFDAASAMEHAARLATDDPRLWSLAGIFWGGVHEWERSEAALARAMKLGSNDHEVVAARIDALTMLERPPQESIKLLEQAIKREPDEPLLWQLKAETYLRLEQPEEALSGFRRAEKLGLEPGPSLFGQAQAFEQLGDFINAHDAASRASDLLPEQPEVYFLLGAICVHLARLDEAERAVSRAVELNPDEPTYRAALATVWVRQGLIERALKLVDGLPVNDPVTHLALIESLMLREQWQHAHTFLAITPKPSEPLWFLVSAAFSLITTAAQHLPLDAPLSHLAKTRDRYAAALPVSWDFEPVERILLSLDDPTRTLITQAIETIC
jgi:tetratricopeptide (TPR) repeat protein